MTNPFPNPSLTQFAISRLNSPREVGGEGICAPKSYSVSRLVLSRRCAVGCVVIGERNGAGEGGESCATIIADTVKYECV